MEVGINSRHPQGELAEDTSQRCVNSGSEDVLCHENEPYSWRRDSFVSSTILDSDQWDLRRSAAKIYLTTLLTIPAKLCYGFNNVRSLSKDLVTYYSSTSRPAVVISDLPAVVQVYEDPYPFDKYQKNNGNHIFFSCSRGNSKLSFECASELKRKTASTSHIDETL